LTANKKLALLLVKESKEWLVSKSKKVWAVVSADSDLEDYYFRELDYSVDCYSG